MDRLLFDSVAGYHMHRGTQVESTWGLLLLAASRFGYRMFPNYQFGANEAVSGLSGELKVAGLTLSLFTLVAGTGRIARSVDPGDVPRLVGGMFGLLCLLTFFGTVFSPQFVIWLIALSAAAFCNRVERLRVPLLLILPIAALTQAVFPFTINDVLAPFYAGGREAGSILGLLFLGARNALVLVAGLATLRWLNGTQYHSSSGAGANAFRNGSSA